LRVYSMNPMRPGDRVSQRTPADEIIIRYAVTRLTSKDFSLSGRCTIYMLYNIYIFIILYEVVYLFKTSEIRTDFGVLYSVIIYQMHILLKKKKVIGIPTIYLYIIFNINIISYADDESPNRVPARVESRAVGRIYKKKKTYDVLIKSVRLCSDEARVFKFPTFSYAQGP
jgi:hypothetical protein